MEALQEEIERLVTYSLSDKSNKNKSLLIKHLSDEDIMKFHQVVPIILDGYKHMIYSYAIHHTLKSHGNIEKEALRGQIAVSIDDFKLIPIILETPDRFYYERDERRNKDIVVYEKLIDNKYVCVEEIRVGKKKNMFFQSMRILKQKPTTTIPKEE